MQLEGYEIRKQISQGPVSTTYLAEQTALRRPVLVKRLNAQWLDEWSLKERLRREALISARLEHPNVVKMIDVRTEGEAEEIYLIIEYIDGLDLKRFIDKYYPLPYPIIANITCQIAAGLAYAHDNGIIHRDIKPANILLSRKGVVKIADFGLARADDLPVISMHGEVVGTLAYMSPEQARSGKLDQRSDLFSLGVLIYELSTGELPFAGEALGDIIQKIVTFTPPQVHDTRPDIPIEFSRLTAQLLEKNPARRPDSAAIFLQSSGIYDRRATPEELASYIGVEEESTKVSSLPAGEPVPRRVRRTGIAAGLAAMLVLGTMAWIMFSSAGNFSPESTALTSALPAEKLVAGEAIDDPANRPQEILIGGQPDLDGTDEAVPQPIFEPTLTHKTGKNMGETSPELSGAVRPQEAKGEEVPVRTIERTATMPLKTTASPTAGLFVACSPWAEIFLDGEPYDTTPLDSTIRVPPGNYRLELRNPGFAVYARDITLTADLTESIIVKLRPNGGFLKLDVSPWARVLIDGKYLDTTPLTNPLSLSEGTYLLTLENPLCMTWADSVTIHDRETVSLQVALERREKI